MRRCITLFLLLFASCYSFGQLTVSRAAPNNSINYLVKNVLLGSGVTVSNITFSGDDTAIGYFNGVSSNIGLDSGMILTNCAVTDAPGPNNSPSTGFTWPKCGTYHDSDLAALIGDTYTDTHSSAILEFDFIPYSDTVSFQYVFASEEYPEYVNTPYNDVFGFFVSGPGIVGPYSHNAENIALIPFTSTPVAINNVNCNLNSNYYVCNWWDTTSYPCMVGCPTLAMMPTTTVQFDGFTTPLTATAVVECGKQYHIKIAIANIGDCIYGSGVFLKSGSFQSSGTTVSSAISYMNTINPSDTVLYRGTCGKASLYFERGSGTYADTILIDTSGTALAGVDYSPIPDTIIMGKGVKGDTLNINAFPSTKTGIQTIVLDIIQRSCGTTDTQKVTIYIGNPDTLKAKEPPLIVCSSGSVILSPTVTGGVPSYNYKWNTGATTSTITVSGITSDTTFIMKVYDVCGDTTRDTVHVNLISNIPLKLTSKDTTIFCPDSIASIAVKASGGKTGYIYSWSIGATTSTITVHQTATTSYIVTVTDSCGEVRKDTVTVTVGDKPLTLTARDTSVNCMSSTMLVAKAGGGGNGYTYLWSNGATTSTISVSPRHDTTYIVTVHSPCGNQTKTDTVKVKVNSPALTVTTNATSAKCPGDPITISASGTGSGFISYKWKGLGGGPTHIVKPTTTTTYYVTVFDSCGNQVVKDSVTVNVPVFPPMSSQIYPDTITVCIGELLNLISTTKGGTGSYTYAWTKVGPFGDTIHNSDSSKAYLYGYTSAIYNLKITDGCDNSTSENVVVNVIPDCNIIIPNVITPNGDATNQYFYIKNLDKFPGSKLDIYDRWGKIVYESSDYQNNWEGLSSSGAKLSDGVYYYILYLSTGKKYPGFVQLIR